MKVSELKVIARRLFRFEIGVPFRTDADEAVAEYSSDPEALLRSAVKICGDGEIKLACFKLSLWKFTAQGTGFKLKPRRFWSERA